VSDDTKTYRTRLSDDARRTVQIKAALLAKRQEIAKLQLTSRKALESLLAQRVKTLTNLTAALSSIDQAHGDAAIMKAYESSSKVLKEILSKPELQRERVDEVMDKLREGMEGAEDIRKAVEEGGWEVIEASGSAVDEDELQRELEQIVAQETAKEEARKAGKLDPAADADEKRLLELAKRFDAQRLSEKTPISTNTEKVAEVA
jgi:charged multivesicular body protein 7